MTANTSTADSSSLYGHGSDMLILLHAHSDRDFDALIPELPEGFQITALGCPPITVEESDFNDVDEDEYGTE